MQPIIASTSDAPRGRFAHWSGILALAWVLWLSAAAAAAEDPLPSWNQGPSKQAIQGFVAAVIAEGSPDYVPPAERIAVFDNDGTLWVE